MKIESPAAKMRRTLNQTFVACFVLLAAFLRSAERGSAHPLHPADATIPRGHTLSAGLSTPKLQSSPTPQPPSLADAPVLNSANTGGLEPLAQVSYGAWQLVTALAWSPDGRWIAAAVGERIELLEFPGLQEVTSYRTGSLTHGLAFSPDSTWLAAASRDGYLRIWPTAALVGAAQSEPALAVQAHRKGANVAIFSPQSSPASGAPGWLAASGGNDAVARFWNVSSGENIGLMVGGSFAVPSIAFLPDGAQLAVTNGDRIRLRVVGSERIAGTFASDASLYSLDVSPDGRWIAAGATDNQVRVWSVDSAYRTGQERYPEALIFAGHNGRPGTFRALVWRVCFSPAGDLLASTGGDGALAIWAVDAVQMQAPGAQFAPLALRAAHPGGATSLAFHPQGRLIVTGGLDGGIILWGIR